MDHITVAGKVMTSQSAAASSQYSENSRCLWQLASLVAQTEKNLPAMQETQVLSLDQEDPLKKGMTTHASIRAWEIPRAEEPGGL